MREAELVYGLLTDDYTEGNVPTKTIRHAHYVRGAKGAVSFSYSFLDDPFSAKLMLPEQIYELIALMPTGVDVHSREPLYLDQPRQSQCLALGTGEGCFADGSGLRAYDWLDEFQTYGMEWLRDKLAEEYHLRFYPDDYELTTDERIERMDFGQAMRALGSLLGE